MRDLDVKLLQELSRIIPEPETETVPNQQVVSETRNVRRTKK